MVFQDRTEAGRKLAQVLRDYKNGDVLVYAIPRGGVAVGAEVADYLQAPLALIFPRKIGHPASPEYAIGAVTEAGDPIWNEAELSATGADWRQEQVGLARKEAKRRRLAYEGDQVPMDAQGKTAIIVDDGIATSLTMMAAAQDLRQRQPKQIIVAVPVAPEDASYKLMRYADKVVVLDAEEHLGAVGAYYRDFEAVEDEEVRQLVQAYRKSPTVEPLDLAALNSVVATVKRYPVTGAQMSSRARRLRAPRNVVQFFESLPTGVAFASKADIMVRSEEAELLMEEEVGQPEEQLRSYE